MAKSALWKKGDAVRTRLMGQAAVKTMNKGVYNDPIMDKFGDYAREAVFGMLWSRPGLDLKTRALICVISDTATHAWPELAIHLRMRRQDPAAFDLSVLSAATEGFSGAELEQVVVGALLGALAAGAFLHLKGGGK